MASVKSMFKHKLTIGKLTTLMVDQVSLTLMPQIVNQMPNAPPLLKAGVDLATGLGQLELAGKIADTIPAPFNKLVKVGIELEGFTQIIQALPNLMSAMGNSSSFLVGTPSTTTA